MTRFDGGLALWRAGVVVWVVALTGIAGRVCVARPGAQSVVPIYAAAGEHFARAEPLYDYRPPLDLYRNPPAVAAAFAPLGVLPPKVLGLLVRAAEAGLFLSGLVRFRRAAFPGWSLGRVGGLYLLAAVVVLPAVNNGQLNTLIAAAVLHGTAAGWRGRDREAAAWFAVAGWVKLYPFAAGLLAGVARPRMLVWLALAAAAGFALPFAVQSSGYVRAEYAHWQESVGADDRADAHPSRVPRDWTTWPRSLAGVTVPTPAAHAVSLAAAGAAAALAARAWRRGPRAGLLDALVLSSVWMTAFGPATESNTYALLAAVAPVVVLRAPAGWPRRLAAGGVALLLGTAARGFFPEDWQWQVHGPQPLGALLLLAAHLLTPAPTVDDV